MRTVGEGNLKKVLWLIGAAVIALLVATWLEPFGQGYGVKTAAKVLCADMVRAKAEEEMAKRGGTVVQFDDKRVRDNFIKKTQGAGVKFDNGDFDIDCGSYLKKDQPHCFSYHYSFDAQTDQHVCKIHVRYESDTPPAFIGQVLQELPHLKMHQHIKMEQRVNKSF